jgi:pimeloyl-ACP methyl ester carboxylesterase
MAAGRSLPHDVALRRHARLVTFPGLGHLFFWEDPGAFVRTVLEFLAAAEPA